MESTQLYLILVVGVAMHVTFWLWLYFLRNGGA